ncbi:hypothetical protein [Gramella sp. MAR_2010_147]|uniref:hypothetical protein n=1 Tax=Gramella sp. MAR_2010_147 TaxID=1250205 RepID=UPI00087C604D|nr:hypothetical protein [Gramella sp. MAR_2010_147]SDS53477.1 hypothetical protein SAMN04488553_2478 [Gramella sp. MAR_2010_147]
MKTITKQLVLVLMLSIIGAATGQEETNQSEEQEYQPVYITMTTTHWSDDPETDFSDWLDTEKQYFENVTKKNDLILSSGVYTHYFTADNSEVMLVNVYRTWEDIEKANEINQKLVEEAWPDEDERQKFFEKQAGYYEPDHNDEIYQSMEYMIPETEGGEEPRIYYVRTSELSMNGEGSPEKFKEYFEKVTKKSKKLKGYYTHRHLWGSNSREFSEVFVFDSLGEIEDFFDEEQELTSASWLDENERNAFIDDMGKLFTGRHGDYVYRSVPELMK